MKIIFMSIPVTLVNVGIVPRRIPRVLGQMNLLEKKGHHNVRTCPLDHLYGHVSMVWLIIKACFKQKIIKMFLA